MALTTAADFYTCLQMFAFQQCQRGQPKLLLGVNGVVFSRLIERVAMRLSFPASSFAELLVIEYPVGSLINWHRNAPPFSLLVGISLNADCTFKLRPYVKEAQTRKSIISVSVRRRSLYVMQGKAREAWQHSTGDVKEVRYSITLRTLRENERTF